MIMKRKSIITELRKAIVESGYTQYQLSELSGVSRAQINRFVKGERTLTLEPAEKIAKVLGLELRPKKKKG
ncbi:MAG: helix-turn-helix transcriptional regulator [Planctomycetota bacterium]